MNELRCCHLSLYEPIYDHLGALCVDLKEIFWIPYTKFVRSHISCSRKKVKKR